MGKSVLMCSVDKSVLFACQHAPEYLQRQKWNDNLIYHLLHIPHLYCFFSLRVDIVNVS